MNRFRRAWQLIAALPLVSRAAGPLRFPDSAGGAGKADEKTREAELVRRVKAGGDDAKMAFRELVEMHQNWLVYFLSCLVGNTADAEDVAQDVMVRAYLAIDRFRGDSRFKTWLRRIAMNQAFNHRRSRKRRPATSLEAESIDIAYTDTGAAGVIEREVLTSVMAELPYISREVLLLHHVEEMQLKEISGHLDIGLSAAKMRLKRARDQFGEIYDRLTGVDE